MIIKYQKNKYGFTTLFAVLLLGSITLAVVIYISSTSFWTMRNSIDMKYATQARYAVDSCMEQVLELIRNNNNLVRTNEQLEFEGYVCQYTISNLGGQVRLIDAQVAHKNFFKRIEVKTTNLNPITLEYWVEQ
jgi:hypothetical protein